MKLLFIFLVTSFLISGCNSLKEVIKNSPAASAEPSVTITLLIEAFHNQVNLNDVLSACGNVKPFRTFNLNYISAEKMELQLIYTEISVDQRQELFDCLNGLGGVKVLNVSGL